MQFKKLFCSHFGNANQFQILLNRKLYRLALTKLMQLFVETIQKINQWDFNQQQQTANVD